MKSFIQKYGWKTLTGALAVAGGVAGGPAGLAVLAVKVATVAKAGGLVLGAFGLADKYAKQKELLDTVAGALASSGTQSQG